MARIGIVGGLGVGKAHAIAALNLGHTLSFVVDVDPKASEVYSRSVLVNQWGSFYEEAVLERQVPVYKTLTGAMMSTWNAPDLIIIATPDSTHDLLVRQAVQCFPESRVLCEKPYKSDVIDDRVLVSAEWIYHSKLAGVHDPITALAMYHNNMPTDGSQWNHVIKYDLGFHLMSIIGWQRGFDVAAKVDHAATTPVNWGGEVQVLGFDDVIEVAAMYNPNAAGVTELIGAPLIEDAEIIVRHGDTTTYLDWEAPLFERQISSVLRGVHPVTSKVAVGIDFKLG